MQQERDEEPEDDGEEELRDGGLPCNVNRGGFPVDEETWDRMWRHVARIHPSGEHLEKEIRGATDLPKIPPPSVPTYQPTTTIPQRLEAIQKYIRDLQYNHTGTQFFEIKKSRPLTALMDIAKEMTREALPIKCLEAVILGISQGTTSTTSCSGSTAAGALARWASAGGRTSCSSPWNCGR